MNDQSELYRLAKSLNAVEKVHIDTGMKLLRSSSNLCSQIFRYIIVIDFEATCWEKEVKEWRSNEIIEFPAVLLDVSNAKIVSEFHQYVMPIENPRLSTFCMKLTGILQHQVDNGVPLHTCLSLFDKWVKQIIDQFKLILPKTKPDNLTGNVAFATWTDWDLGKCLKNECSRKKISKPSYLNQWIDVRALYKNMYQNKPENFENALHKIGMQFQGRPHCGLDDTRNLARLIAHMCRDGVHFVITKDLNPFEMLNK